MLGYNISIILGFICVVCIILLLSCVELLINERKCKFSMPIPKAQACITDVTYYPIYIYNKRKIKRSNLDYKIGYNAADYVKVGIPEHIASKVAAPLKESINSFHNIHSSRMPINALYSSVGKSEELLTVSNPLSYMDTSQYRMLIHKNDIGSIEAFFAGDMLYLI